MEWLMSLVTHHNPWLGSYLMHDSVKLGRTHCIPPSATDSVVWSGSLKHRASGAWSNAPTQAMHRLPSLNPRIWLHENPVSLVNWGRKTKDWLTNDSGIYTSTGKLTDNRVRPAPQKCLWKIILLLVGRNSKQQWGYLFFQERWIAKSENLQWFGGHYPMVWVNGQGLGNNAHWED